MDSFIRLVEASAKLLGGVAWPLVAVAFLTFFGNVVRNFIAGVSEGSFKGFGFEGSAKRIVQAAVVNADLAKQPTESSEAGQIPSSVGKSLAAVDYAANLLRSPHGQSDRGRRLLWVDDQPDNNLFEISALENLGFHVDQAMSTGEAMHDIAKAGKYDVIISDYVRSDDVHGGLTLIQKLKAINDDTPVVFYTSIEDPGFRREMQSAGAFAVTDLASELIMRVAEAVEGEATWSRSAAKRLRHLRASS